jgi:hypothetical protein
LADAGIGLGRRSAECVFAGHSNGVLKFPLLGIKRT